MHRRACALMVNCVRGPSFPRNCALDKAPAETVCIMDHHVILCPISIVGESCQCACFTPRYKEVCDVDGTILFKPPRNSFKNLLTYGDKRPKHVSMMQWCSRFVRIKDATVGVLQQVVQHSKKWRVLGESATKFRSDTPKYKGRVLKLQQARGSKRARTCGLTAPDTRLDHSGHFPLNEGSECGLP